MNAYRPARACALALLCAWSVAPAAPPAPALRTLEDSPGRLVIEADIPAIELVRLGGEGWRAACGGCDRQGDPGAPDLPFTTIHLAAGSGDPRVAVEVLASEAREVPEGVAPAPYLPNPGSMVYRRDEAAWLASAAGSARTGPSTSRAGRTVRDIRIPLARWSEAGRILTSLRKARITIQYAAVADCGMPMPVSLAAEVANPRGGACLAGPVRALAKTMRPAAQPRLGDSLMRVNVGDADPGSFGEDKVYALAFAAFIAKAPSAVAVPWSALRLYAGPADTLATTPAGDPSPGTLRQVPVEMRDANGNGVFDGGDSLLFFGRGSSVWKRLPGEAGPIRFAFSGDPASRMNSYWLDFSGRDPEPALRLAPAAAMPRALSLRDYSRHYLRAERDQLVLACESHPDTTITDSAAGTFWFWLWGAECGKGNRQRTISGSQLAMPETENPEGAAQSAGDSLFVGMFAYPYQAEDDFSLRLEGGSGPLSPVRTSGQGNWYVSTDPLPGGRFRFASVEWGGADGRFEGYTLCYRRRLELAGQPLRIFPEAFGGRVSYAVKGGEGAACVRVEGGVGVKRMVLDGDGVFTDSLAAGSDATWLVYRAAAAPEAASISLELPGLGGKALRDLASADGTAPEYLILAPAAFADEAMALAKYRNDPARAIPLRTSVAIVEDVYRQYSGGRACAAALRDFLRWGWSEWGGGQAGPKPLRHALLFGDGHYDVLGLRSASRGETARNRIPVFEWLTGGNYAAGAASDDYYSLLDPGEAPADTGAKADLSIGRIPANSPDQARDYLAKIKAWEDPARGGRWRSRITFAADDGIQKNDRSSPKDVDGIKQGHTTSSDGLARQIESQQPGLAADKVYMVDYPLNALWHKPEATQDLFSFINDGTSLVNFVGHGSYNQWADEVLLQSNDGLARMRNEGRTPMINAFSCTVGRFDDFAKVGLSELFVTAAGKGAIAAVSAVRESYPDENVALAQAFYRYAFPPQGSPAMPVGEALRLAKNSLSGQANFARNSALYALLGEPVMLLRKPALAVSLEQAPDTLRALDCGSFKGRVEGGSGSGLVNIRVLSQSRHRQWPPPFSGANVDTQYAELRGSVLFEGTVPYAGGRFDAGYFMPAQIAFGDTNVRILAYAWDAKREAEGTAAKTGIAIQGGSAGACAVDGDGKGPRIRISGCEGDEAGGVDFPDRVRLPLPNCLEVTVEDSSGGVLSSDSPDDGTVFEVPGALAPFHPKPGIDEVYRKVFRLPLEAKELGMGARTLKVLARDGYGNRSVRTLAMDLTADSSMRTVAAYNVPNPVKRNGTTFYFSSVLPARTVDYSDPEGGGGRVDFEVRVFDQAGRLVRKFPGARSGDTRWDGRDAWGNTMGNGIYFYQVMARHKATGEATSRRNTLILSR